MSSFKITLIMLISCIVAPSAFADIYEWTDENGVRHYSNYAPAAKSTVLMKTKEEPYDEAADRARMEAERQARLEFDRLELAEREAELELREAEAERKQAEADRLAQEAADRLAQDSLREADDYGDEIFTNSRVIYQGGSYWCPDYRYGCNYPIYQRWYDRKKHIRSSHHQFSRLSPHRHKRYVKKPYGSSNHEFDHKYRHKTRHRHNGSNAKLKLNSRAATNYSPNRIGSAGTRLNRRGSLSWKSSGFGRRY